MSYLALPRIHFAGFFQADVSTVNNDVRHFDSSKFQPEYQLPQESRSQMNGWWNPEGTGAWRLVQCKVTAGVCDGELLTSPDEDPVIGMMLAGADGRVCGKLVDLDPQQQSCSEIWGLQVRLTNEDQKDAFQSDFRVAPFIDLWRRQQGSSQGDQTLAAQYQSVLQNIVWHDLVDSRLLKALQSASKDLLSIKFNVFGFKLDSTLSEFTLGRIIGTIGPATADEPSQFVFGRHMMANIGSNPTTAAQNVYNFPSQVHADAETVSVDFGNALPISDGDGTMLNLGVLSMGVLKDDQVENGDIVAGDQLEPLGEVPYLEPDWYPTTAGVIDFSYSGNDWLKSHLEEMPLALVRPAGNGQYQVLVRESQAGLYVRAEGYVHRLNPGDSATVNFYSSRYGKPHAGDILLAPNNAMIGGGAGPTPLTPPVSVPQVGQPTNAVSYPQRISSDDTGRATATITASSAGPGNPRGYIDGQLFGVGFQLADQPANYQPNPWLFISLLVWDYFEEPDKPTWYGNVQRILQQYGNLYPIMSRHLVDLGDYDSVTARRDLMKLAMSLPIADPNFMPVTRDLSEAKRRVVLKWLDTSGPDGLPLKGQSAEIAQLEPTTPSGPVPMAAPQAMESAAGQRLANDPTSASSDASSTGGGKTAFIESLKHKDSN